MDYGQGTEEERQSGLEILGRLQAVPSEQNIQDIQVEVKSMDGISH